MSTIGRSPPPLLVAAVKSMPAAVPQSTDPAHAASPPAASPHHPGGHHPHHATGEGHAPHGHVHATPHAPKPRKPPKPRKGRRKNSSGEPGEEDELDIGDDESHACGTTPVSMDSGHHDGGDNHDQGESENKREERIQRAHFEKDKAPTLARVERSPTPRRTDTAFATHRYQRGLCAALVGPRPCPDAVARVVDLDLELMRATPDVAQVDKGGIARARANLLAHAPPVPLGSERPLPDSPAGRLNCIAVMKELQLQRRKSTQERQQTRAHLEVRQRARTR